MARILPMYRSLPIRLLLVFALLFSQLGGLTHGIAHALEEQSHDQSLPHDRLCDLCATYAQLGSALGGHATQFTPLEQHAVFVSASSATFHSTAFTAFAARAPPYSA
ncbi:MAG: hypothetical protein NUV75_11065 [Gallionella sp.]|nr:hypothetical protein [Gallionella sp.]